MRFQFDNQELAEGFAIGLGDPDGLDVVASAEGCVVEVLGLDDHDLIAPEIRRSALELGAKEL